MNGLYLEHGHELAFMPMLINLIDFSGRNLGIRDACFWGIAILQ
jgi:predicted cobalt transporter CbtA